MEAFDLAVGLRPVGPGALGLDTQLGAGVAPGVGAVGRAVVGQHPLHGDAAGGEPGHRPAQHADGGGSGLVVVDLGLGDPAVVVEHGVHERGADLGVVVRVARLAGGGGPILVALGAADVAPAAAVGDVAQLLDVDVQHRAGGVVLVAADRLAGGPVDVGEPVYPAAHQHRVHRGGGHTHPVGDGHRAQPLLPPQVHDLAHDWLRGAPRAAVRA